MKGMVFTEFLEMVEEAFSMEVADEIIGMANLPSGGAYTSLGSYDHTEMLSLVTHLAQKVGAEVPDLVQAFGKHLFGRFHVHHPELFAGTEGTFDFLRNVDAYIHVEVRKLYPDAELPKFDFEQPSQDTLRMTYRSSRPFADLAHGLVHGCIEHFHEKIDVHYVLLDEARNAARFELTQRAA